MPHKFQTTLISAASAQDTAGTLGPALCAANQAFAFHVKWGTGVTAGVVKIEAADDAAYTGTWANLATVTFAGTAPNQDVVQVSGTGAAMRARISTAVSNGTVTVVAVGN